MTDAAFYSREYNNRELVPDNEQWTAQWEQASAQARASMSCQLDQRYGDAAGEAVDIFPAARATAAAGCSSPALERAETGLLLPCPGVGAGVCWRC